MPGRSAGALGEIKQIVVEVKTYAVNDGRDPEPVLALDDGVARHEEKRQLKAQLAHHEANEPDLIVTHLGEDGRKKGRGGG